MNVVPLRRQHDWTALEFFAGIGLARAGLELAGIKTLWANDYDINKKAMYEGQWGGNELLLADVHSLCGDDLPTVDVAWSSSPCTDLSLAGKRAGLRGGRESSAFFGFTRLIAEMKERKPKVIALENVTGLASSHNREDLRAAAKEFNSLGYAVDAITLDARRFIPQSRPRLFLIGAQYPIDGGEQDTCLRPDWLAWLHEDAEIRTFMMPLPKAPDLLSEGLTREIEQMPHNDPRWWGGDRVKRFVDSMAPVQRERLEAFIELPNMTARTAYRRTRNGIPVWEMRAEDVSGCLRTARGGSSKQAVVIMGGGSVKIRWMTGLEYARLMGAGWYSLDNMRDSQVHYGFGDAVAVPVVGWIAKHMLIPHLVSIQMFDGKIING
ncbi:DNA (cytosine-5-)-methyltransferase [Photorhabdus laumondii subsp. laumondii]|uniref:DNA (cytosine-5-)-methyltransferase n=2 Tax=Photorhabdus laumondii subsp. laumondii TaxID=141679 RepID=Q7N8W5_PHOLL|nr:MULTISPECIES: DNA (cytosine-5-)-methyltransferase [Photorhabdus]AWK40553.1 cytosine methyltransferase [Photorhabdus laumondii subsp. laumondii]AXG41361.1 DNA (cytosine-5-)-methyltransferase [Photorhabdus laumondii subsp. laumondii]AXG45892.1 DNA (cytosine-5-)-methyltransferase [Photorhabdus laumondii subsp. laumondii]KTL63361.1 cytosine methyltransferase [Photorhabdus laumondii subsp. laumondii]MCC8382348.1 DNA (cytosine-5-)-methyltransferase [Photorhabdus laumondii]